MLAPPPLPLQAVSSVTFRLEDSCRDVPPTPTTALSEASYSAWRGPLDEWPEESGLEPASPLETKTLTPAAASFRNFWCWVATSPEGPPRNFSPRPRLIESWRMPGWAGRSAMMRSRARSRFTKLKEPAAYTRIFALGATPLDHSTSRVSSPSAGGSTPPPTLMNVTLEALVGRPLRFQKAVRSFLSGTVSMRIAMV